jgi:hypothetical protein
VGERDGGKRGGGMRASVVYLFTLTTHAYCRLLFRPLAPSSSR